MICILFFSTSVYSEDKSLLLPLDLTKWEWFAKEGFHNEFVISKESFQKEHYRKVEKFPILLNSVFANPVGEVSIKEYTLFFKPEDAVHAAVQMKEELRSFNVDRLRAGYKEIRVGIGVNTGMLMMGTVGHQDRFNTTAIGDAVNVAARVESITKLYATLILITESTCMKLNHPNDFLLRPIDYVQVKGKTELIKVFECFSIDSPEQIEKKKETIELLENAMILLENKKFQQATAYWIKILASNPDDKIAKYHLANTPQVPEAVA
jgi:hypothetical protein